MLVSDKDPKSGRKNCSQEDTRGTGIYKRTAQDSLENSPLKKKRQKEISTDHKHSFKQRSD